MAAQPERVNLDRVLGQASPPAATPCPQTRSWRVVREDGSKASLGPEPDAMAAPHDAIPAATCDDAAHAAPCPGAAAASTRQRLMNLATLGLFGGQTTSTSATAERAKAAARTNIGMPKAKPQLADEKPASQRTTTQDPLACSATSGHELFSSAATAPCVSSKTRKPPSKPTPAETERDLQLLRVIDAWPTLSPRAREAVVAVIEASRSR